MGMEIRKIALSDNLNKSSWTSERLPDQLRFFSLTKWFTAEATKVLHHIYFTQKTPL